MEGSDVDTYIVVGLSLIGPDLGSIPGPSVPSSWMHPVPVSSFVSIRRSPYPRILSVVRIMSPSLVDRSISVHSPPRLSASLRNLVVASAEPPLDCPTILWGSLHQSSDPYRK